MTEIPELHLKNKLYSTKISLWAKVRYIRNQPLILYAVQTTVVLRFLNLEAGPRGSFICGGCVRAKRTSSGRKSLWRDVGRGFVLSIATSLVFRSGSLSEIVKDIWHAVMTLRGRDTFSGETTPSKLLLSATVRIIAPDVWGNTYIFSFLHENIKYKLQLKVGITLRHVQYMFYHKKKDEICTLAIPNHYRSVV